MRLNFIKYIFQTGTNYSATPTDARVYHPQSEELQNMSVLLPCVEISIQHC